MSLQIRHAPVSGDLTSAFAVPDRSFAACRSQRVVPECHSQPAASAPQSHTTAPHRSPGPQSRATIPNHRSRRAGAARRLNPGAALSSWSQDNAVGVVKYSNRIAPLNENAPLTEPGQSAADALNWPGFMNNRPGLKTLAGSRQHPAVNRCAATDRGSFYRFLPKNSSVFAFGARARARPGFRARIQTRESDAGFGHRMPAPDARTGLQPSDDARPFRLRSGCGGEPGAHAGCLLSAPRRAGSQRAADATPRAHPPRADGPVRRSTPGTVLRPLPAPGWWLRRRIFCTGSKTMAQAAPCPGWKQAPYATTHPRKAHRPGWV